MYVLIEDNIHYISVENVHADNIHYISVENVHAAVGEKQVYC
jgi:hypothetical protein